MRKIKIFGFCFLVALLFLSPMATGAVADQADENVYIGPGEVLNQNVFKAGNTVIIEGEINGDLFVAGNVISIKGPIAGSIFVAGNSVNISSKVGGSIFAAGNSVVISGEVDGSIRAAGSNLTIDAKVMENVLSAGANLNLSNQSSVGWDALLAGASINTNGPIARNAEFYGSSVVVNSQIAGNVKVELDGESPLTLLPGTKILGNLEYKAPKEELLQIQEGAEVVGETNFNVFDEGGKEDRDKAFSAFFSVAKLIWFFSLLIVGLIAIAALKKPTKDIAEEIVQNPLKSIGWGLVYFVVTPIIAFLLLFTIIGIPLSLIIIVFYIASLYLVKIFIAIAIGAWLINLINKKKEPGLGWSLVLGLIVFFILTMLPFIGWIIKLVAVWWGLGAAMTVKMKLLKKING